MTSTSLPGEPAPAPRTTRERVLRTAAWTAGIVVALPVGIEVSRGAAVVALSLLMGH